MTSDTYSLAVVRKIFFRIAHDPKEYIQSVVPTQRLIEELHRLGVDVFSFLERKWCCPIHEPSETWVKGEDNIAILHLSNYEDWYKGIGKKTRNMIRKANKSGINLAIAPVDDKLAEGIWKIFNETPIRQGRGFPHYGTLLETVKRDMLYFPNCTYVGAYYESDLVGFIHLIHGDRITIISQILSMQKHWDKSVNNALISKTIEFCANNNHEWIMYGRMGNHPTLDDFKESNGFRKLTLNRYFLPLSQKGQLAVKLKLHRDIRDTLPQSLKNALFPLYSFASRTRARTKIASK